MPRRAAAQIRPDRAGPRPPLAPRPAGHQQGDARRQEVDGREDRLRRARDHRRAHRHGSRRAARGVDQDAHPGRSRSAPAASAARPTRCRSRSRPAAPARSPSAGSSSSPASAARRRWPSASPTSSSTPSPSRAAPTSARTTSTAWRRPTRPSRITAGSACRTRARRGSAHAGTRGARVGRRAAGVGAPIDGGSRRRRHASGRGRCPDEPAPESTHVRAELAAERGRDVAGPHGPADRVALREVAAHLRLQRDRVLLVARCPRRGPVRPSSWARAMIERARAGSVSGPLTPRTKRPSIFRIEAGTRRQIGGRRRRRCRRRRPRCGRRGRRSRAAAEPAPRSTAAVATTISGMSSMQAAGAQGVTDEDGLDPARERRVGELAGRDVDGDPRRRGGPSASRRPRRRPCRRRGGRSRRSGPVASASGRKRAAICTTPLGMRRRSSASAPTMVAARQVGDRLVVDLQRLGRPTPARRRACAGAGNSEARSPHVLTDVGQRRPERLSRRPSVLDGRSAPDGVCLRSAGRRDRRASDAENRPRRNQHQHARERSPGR